MTDEIISGIISGLVVVFVAWLVSEIWKKYNFHKLLRNQTRKDITESIEALRTVPNFTTVEKIVELLIQNKKYITRKDAKKILSNAINSDNGINNETYKNQVICKFGDEPIKSFFADLYAKYGKKISRSDQEKYKAKYGSMIKTPEEILVEL